MPWLLYISITLAVLVIAVVVRIWTARRGLK